MLKKLRFWLFRRYFSVQIDSQIFVWLLNQSSNDLSNAMIIRWLIYIRLFDFDIKYISSNKNNAADSLSRRGQDPEDESNDNPNDYFESQLYSVSARSLAQARPLTRVYLCEEYTDDDLVLGRYLETLERPEGLSDVDYQNLRKKSRNFLV